jgi:RelA/SpoT family protein
MNYIRALRQYSNKEVNRAAAQLVSPADDESFDDALDLVSDWRTLHYGPVAVMQAYLDFRAHEVDPNSFVADRLKRIPTIIDKLRRQPTMQLSTMQDIGGLRAVVGTVDQAKALAEKLNPNILPHDLIMRFDLKLPIRDYIEHPAKSGYRGLHLVYTYKHPPDHHLRGLKIEVQVRTRLQHVWATAVEMVGTFRGESLKSGEGNPRWLELFRLAGDLAAQKERTDSPIFSPEFLELRDHLHVFNRLSSYNVGQTIVVDPDIAQATAVHNAKYFVMVLDLQNRHIDVAAFPATRFQEAVEKQREEEARHIGNELIDTVLVSVDSLADLREAYPNYFADTGEFIDLVYGGTPLQTALEPSPSEVPPSEPE